MVHDYRVSFLHFDILNDHVDFAHFFNFPTITFGIHERTRQQDVSNITLLFGQEHDRNSGAFHHSVNHSGNLLLHGRSCRDEWSIFCSLAWVLLHVILRSFFGTVFGISCDGLKRCCGNYTYIHFAHDYFFRIFQEQKRFTCLDWMVGVFVTQ